MATEYLNNRIFEEIIGRFQNAKRNKIKYQLFINDVQETTKRLIKKNIKINDSKILCLQKINQENEVFFKETQNELANAFYLLSGNLVRYAKFNLIDSDDAIQEGVMICFEKIDKFHPKKGKAFNYMTTCILNHFRQLYRTARNYNELKKKYLDHLMHKFEDYLSLKYGKNLQNFKNFNIINNGNEN
jgi:hypothetical protein